MGDGSIKDITNDSNTKYASGNTTIAAVNQSGLITTVTTQIGRRSVITVSNGTKSTTISVTTILSNNSQDIQSISADSNSESIGLGSTKQLHVIATMGDGSTKDITNDVNTKYVSGNTTIATVNKFWSDYNSSITSRKKVNYNCK